MFARSLLLLFLLLRQDTVWSLRILELRVPAHAQEGGTALLGCQYELGEDELYSVKWYKDNQEFFRYVPRHEPLITAFDKPGIHVNVTRSSDTVVVLENLSRESEGNYECEVSGEAPSFATVRSSKFITIDHSGPRLTGLKEQYYMDDEAIINCTSLASRPAASLKWLVNERPAAEQDLRGPWTWTSADRPDASLTTLQLRFKVEPRHFVNGAIKLKCQATIAPLYQRETSSIHYIGLPFTYINSDDMATASSKRSQAGVLLLSILSILLHMV